MLYLGIDPDLHALAVAVWDHEAGPVTALVVEAKRRKAVVENYAVLDMVKAIYVGAHEATNRLDWIEGIAVESQELKRSGNRQHKRPQDIVTLGQVGGAALMAFAMLCPQAKSWFPKPSEWKGDVQKAAMQAALYTDLGWGYELVRPKSRSKLPGRAPAKAEYARPLRPSEGFDHVEPADWKHVGDALLLARWASRQTK